MSEWQTDETITADKLNRKEAYVGTSAPSNPTDGQLWVDTSQNPPVLKIYDATNSAWKLCITSITQIESRSHADLQNIGENDHHPKIHGHSEHSFGEAEVVANKGAANGYAGLTSIKTLPVDYFEIEASDNVQHSNDTKRSTQNSSWTKVKEIKLLNALRGASLKIKFELLAQGSTTAHAKIYLNGSPIGQDRSTTNTTEWQVFEETFSNGVNLQPGDLLQIYAYSSAGSGTYAHVQNFRLCFDLKPHKFVNQDP